MVLKLITLIINPPNYRDVRKIKEPTYQPPFNLEEQRVRKLLGREEFCDRKHCQFHEHLRSLAVDMEIKPTLGNRFLVVARPSHSSGQSTLEPGQMAKVMADIIMEVALPNIYALCELY
ncbi:hypothetical protein TNCV_2835691 [Trichonephila clavipes]|nr:hypothetical protein TNCV_2835691 [Trichonephila clavipes]